MDKAKARIAAAVAAVVALAGVAGVELGAVEADALTENLTLAGGALFGAYAIAQNWFHKLFGGE